MVISQNSFRITRLQVSILPMAGGTKGPEEFVEVWGSP